MSETQPEGAPAPDTEGPDVAAVIAAGQREVARNEAVAESAAMGAATLGQEEPGTAQEEPDDGSAHLQAGSGYAVNG